MQTFVWIPSYNSALNVKPNVVVTAFGDGYEARTPIGINNKPRKWQLTFTNRANATADAIETFLNDRGASEAFAWTPPRGSAGVWVCREWNLQPSGPNTATVTATFDEVFDT